MTFAVRFATAKLSRFSPKVPQLSAMNFCPLKPTLLWNVVTMEDAEVVVHFLEPITNTKDLTRHEVAKICEERMRAKLQEIWGDEYIANDANAAEALAKAIANG